MKNQSFNILVADGDEAIRFVVSVILRRHGHTVEVVDNGNEAMISANLTSELTSAYQNKRVDKILQKPFTQENLSLTLYDILGQWKGSAGV